MSEPSLRDLERDVENTRAKLARDLTTLRSPSTFADFTEDVKHQAMGTKDALIEQAKTTALSSAQSLLDDLKARAAANPVAALVVGAGIAWRLFKHPPIATALVGAGLYSLWQAKPAGAKGRSNSDYLDEAKSNLQDQAGRLASAARTKAGELTSAAKDQASEFASAAKAQVEDMATTAADQATRFAHDARDKAQEWGSRIAGETRQMSAEAADAAIGTADRLYASATDGGGRAASPVK
jgi:hypothetical protein